jgi:hypothetical protein
VEIGKAEDIILGQKMEITLPDSVNESDPRWYQEV